MPIECKFVATPLSQDDFHVVDKVVMKHAFDIQNNIGRLCDEQAYKNELAYRCQHNGFDVCTEAMIRVTHGNFSKLYSLDMLINSGGIYELKTTGNLHSKHSNQLINYLLLSAVHHGKLINFRPKSVEHRFVSTRLTPALRHQYSINTTEWNVAEDQTQHLEQIIRNLLQDWGAFLDIDLYIEAILHFLPAGSIQPVDILSNGRVISQQNVCLLDKSTGLHISAVKEGLQTYQKHIMRFAAHTNLARIQWINFFRNEIQLVTLRK